MSPTKRVEHGWAERVVSWGHMAVALATLVGVCAGYIIATERRLTVLEAQTLALAERNKQQDEAVASMLQARNTQMSNVERKLDTIAADVVALKVQSATMQTAIQRGGRF